MNNSRFLNHHLREYIRNLSHGGLSLTNSGCTTEGQSPMGQVCLTHDYGIDAADRINLAAMKFFDQVCDHQVKNNISSVLWEEVQWNKETLRFPELVGGLKPLPQDKALMSRWKGKVVEKYLDFLARHQLKPFLIREALSSEDIHNPPVSPDFVRELSREADYATLRGGHTFPVYDCDFGNLLYLCTQYYLSLESFELAPSVAILAQVEHRLD